jgi:hypothetical protein
MLRTILIILAVLWLLGIVTSYTAGGLIHLLIVIAVIGFLFDYRPFPLIAQTEQPISLYVSSCSLDYI